MNVDVLKLSDIELKALAYDLIATIEQNQRNLAVANMEIARRRQAKPVISEIEEEQRARSENSLP